MKKTLKMITITVTMIITLTACGDKEKQDETTKAKTTKAQTTIVNVTDKDGKEVTNAKGEKVTEVVTVKNGTIKKTETTKAIASIAPTIAQQTTKTKVTTTTKATTTTRPTTAPQTTARPITTKPTTTAQANPYGYVNAWGTLAQMENDCKAYAESLEMTYRNDYTLESGHWITPTASYGFYSPEAFKNKLFEGARSYKASGFSNIKFSFVTMDNYQDGRCGKYTNLAKEELGGNKDLVIVYIIVT